jgi:hypothetical protein
MISLVRARAVAKKRNHHYHRIIWLFIMDVFPTAHPLMEEREKTMIAHRMQSILYIKWQKTGIRDAVYILDCRARIKSAL